ncbi:WD40-repeat-containing domain protein [Cladochytrium replicatum]|nr:WD40-repeat-containing domain protein [Cladochytrium replicatum]
MKIKTISRDDVEFTRERKNDIFKVHRNLKPELHPYQRAREYTRALNATKLERLFAKPFVGAMEGHIDGVYCFAKHPTSLTTVLSGSADGELRLWSLSTRQTEWKAAGHNGFVKGAAFVPFQTTFVTVGDDKVVKMWDRKEPEPTATYLHSSGFTGIDHHRSQNMFATSSTQVDLWDHQRAEPVKSLSWEAETVLTVKFNQTETNILGSCGSERTIVLYDIRTSTPIKRLTMSMRSNALAWNPMEAFNFTIGNEDHNLYTFDMRSMDRALNVLKDHVSAVMDVDYSPTGEEIVSGSYDRTVRIFNAREGKSRDVYHTKRMQRVFCVRFSMDSRFVLSGSDDGIIRLWKANSWDPLGVKTAEQERSLQYSKALKDKYRYLPEIKRIDKQRRVPKAISKATKIKRIQIDSAKRKEDNLRKHSAADSVPHVAERKKPILAVE